MRSRLSLIAVLSVLGGALLLAAWMLVDERRTAWFHAAETSANMSQLLGLDIERAIETHDNVMLSIRDRMDRSGLLDRPSSDWRRQMMFSVNEGPDEAGGIMLTDTDGHVMVANVPSIPVGLSLATRDYFKAQQISTGDRMIMGRLLQGSITGQKGIPISRVLRRKDGRFAGVAVCLFRTAYFEHLFAHLSMEPDSAVLVLREGGQVVGRMPPWRTDAAPSDMFGDFEEKMGRLQSGNFEATSTIDGVKRLYSFHRIAGTPLTVFVSNSVNAIYAEWWQRALVSALVGGPLLVASLILGLALSHELERRSAAEREASERGAEFQATFDHSADGLFLLRVAQDDSYIVDRANAALGKIWNLPSVAMEGREPRGFLPASMAARLEQGWADACRKRQSTSEVFGWDLSDRAVTLEIVTTPICEANGEIRFLLCNVRDVTEQAEVVRQLQQAKKLEALGRITAGITHDFNNLLQILLSGMREVMLQVPQEGRASLQSSMQAVTHGVALTRRLLNLARQSVTTARIIDVNQSIARLAELLRWTLGNGIKLNIVAGQNLALVKADDAKLQLCLLNLASNARDAMAEGGQLSIYTRAAPGSEAMQQGLPDTDHTVIVVQDTGPGMEAQTRARVFDAFFSTKGPSKGTGLGLWMVRSLIQEAGGDVRIDSEIGCGTRVSIWLPRHHDTNGTDHVAPDETIDSAPVEAPALRSASTRVSTSASLEVSGASGQGPRILLVDDDILVRQGLTRLLVEAGFNVTSSSDPSEAVGILRADMPLDLLIVDQNMAGLSGAALIGLAHQFHPSLPAVMITGDLEPGHVPPGAALLHKPIDPETLIVRIRACLASASALIA